MKKRKLKKEFKNFLVILVLIILLGVLVYYLVHNFTDRGRNKSSVKVIDEIKEYGYVLEENETSLYKDLFKKLNKVLSSNDVDEKEYAELVSKLFVADYFNLDNKITKNDVGGTQFVHSLVTDNFVLKAKDTFYKGIESNVYNDRKQSLPIVSEITLDEVNLIDFEMNEEEVEAYSVKLDWKYRKDLGYVSSKEFILVKEGKKLSIVETNDIE